MMYFPNPGGSIGGGPYGSPPNPYPLGYGGYNGSYFAPQGYNTFNPYMIQNYQQQAQQIKDEYISNQQNIQFALYKSSCAYRKEDVKEEVENKIFNKRSAKQPDNFIKIPELTDQENFEYNRLLQQEYLNKNKDEVFYRRQSQMNSQYNPSVIARQRELDARDRWMKQEQAKIPANVGLFEFFDKYAWQEYFQAEEARQRRKEEDVNAMYDNNRYNQFMNQFNMNGSIDDMAIRLPSARHEQERAERRKAFFDHLLSS